MQPKQVQGDLRDALQLELVNLEESIRAANAAEGGVT
jgi:hypothetical protein